MNEKKNNKEVEDQSRQIKPDNNSKIKVGDQEYSDVGELVDSIRDHEKEIKGE
jgi:hypothetical protein